MGWISGAGAVATASDRSQLGLPAFEKPQLVLQRLDRGVVVGDELDQLAGPALDAGQVRFLTVEGRILLAAQPVYLAVELLAELLEQVGAIRR